MCVAMVLTYNRNKVTNTKYTVGHDILIKKTSEQREKNETLF